jgi:Siphovirus ReqiPepy6 Gp37-like protein
MSSELYIFNTIGQLVDVIDNYEEISWSRDFQKPGSFSLSINRNLARVENLQKRFILGVKYRNVWDAFFQIETVENGIDESGKGGEMLSIKGREYGQLLEHRLALPPAGQSHDSKNWPAESMIKYYINVNAGPGAAAARQLPNFMVATDQGRGPGFPYDARYQDLLTVITEIGTQADAMGWETTFMPATNTWLFDVIIGVDRTEGTLAPVFFDLELETILQQGWITSEAGLKTFAYVAGQGEGAAREIVQRYLGAVEPAGLDRREMFVDARDLPLTESLQSRGDAKLQETKQEDSVTIEINPLGAFRYREHWNLGDMVTVRNQSWGLRKNMRIISVKLSYKGGAGMASLEIELDKYLPTLRSRVQQEIARLDTAERRV